MRKFVLILTLCLSLTCLLAGAGLTEEKVKVAMPVTRGEIASTGTHGRGFTPPPFDLSESVPKAGYNYASEKRSAPRQYPGSFKLPYVTPVKNQESCDVCWIFASVASLEGKVNDVANGTANPAYSEQNIKNCQLDIQPGKNRCKKLGDSFMATAYLTTNGAVQESCDPYDTSQNTNCKTSCPVQVFPAEMRVISAGSMAANDDIKYALTTYRAPVIASIYSEGMDYAAGGPAVCGGDSQDTDHLVVIVGWDDTKPANGPCPPGAWLIKNSWGTNWGDAGYFWMGYQQRLAGTWTNVYSAYRTPYTGETIYHHDLGCNAYTYGWQNTNYAAVIFTAGQSETLRRVEFETSKPNSTYEIKVFSTWNGPSTAPSNQLGTTKTGSFSHSGFYSVELDTPITLPSGSSFVVQVTTSTAGGDGYGFYFDNGHLPGPAGVSYISNNGKDWSDTATFKNKGIGPVIVHAVTSGSQTPSVQPSDGVWKNQETNLNVYYQTYDTGSAICVASSD
ncbi:MAG: hypothetical protein HQK58_16015, partial [Deltaproteobacteria bacterium]|nr:hypothetical protein [Deltaproteobacteria bacterium]